MMPGVVPSDNPPPDQPGDVNGDYWYKHPVFNSYWQQYQQTTNWYQAHCRSWTRATIAALEYENNALRQCVETLSRRPPEFRVSAAQMPGMWTQTQDQHGNTDNSSNKKRRRRSRTRSLSGRTGTPVFDMEVSEEMMAFFELSAKHKEELRIAREEEKKILDKAEEVNYLPPAERPGTRRATEMLELYGRNAPMIHGMETALQLAFDRNCDRHQPELWPIIPLKL